MVKFEIFVYLANLYRPFITLAALIHARMKVYSDREKLPSAWIWVKRKHARKRAESIEYARNRSCVN